MSDVEYIIVIILGICGTPFIFILLGIFSCCLEKVYGNKLIHNSSPATQASTLAMQNLTNRNRNQTTILNPNDLVLRVNSEVVLNPKPKRTNTLNPPDSRDASMMNPQAQNGPFIIRMTNR